MKIHHTLFGVLLLLFAQQGMSQELKPWDFALGIRTTTNQFVKDYQLGVGAGGQFKISMGKRVNTEWFLDYIVSKHEANAFRNDKHIGWSVQFALNKAGFGGTKITPYILGGQCFDLTRVRSTAQEAWLGSHDSGQVFSAAVQAGLGASWFVHPRWELTLQAQYMMHIGKEVEVLRGPGDAVIGLTTHKHTSPEGHLLFNFSTSFYLLRQ